MSRTMTGDLDLAWAEDGNVSLVFLSRRLALQPHWPWNLIIHL